jgi:DHA1 family tetracycline resistance protein-like MFS transporter
MMQFFRKNALPALLLTVLLDMLGLGMVMPILPLLFNDVTSPFYMLDIAHAEQGALYLGLLMALVAFGQFIGAPIIGQLSDKFGRRKLLIITIIGGAIANALFAVALVKHAFGLLFFSRLAYGLMAGNVSVASAAIADITPPEKRAKNFGLMGAMFGIGFIVGPFVGGLLASPSVYHGFNATTPFIAGVILAAINALYVWLVLPETNDHVNKTLNINWSKALLNIKKALQMKEVRPMLITAFLFNAGIAFYQGFGALILNERFGFTEANIGNYFAYVGIWLVVVQAALVPFLAKKFHSAQVLSVSLFVQALCFYLISINYSFTYALVIVPFLAVGWGLTMANMGSLLSQTATPSIMGEVMGINTSVGALAQMLVPFLGGYLASSYSVGTSVAFGALTVALAGIYFVFFAKHELKAHA